MWEPPIKLLALLVVRLAKSFPSRCMLHLTNPTLMNSDNFIEIHACTINVPDAYIGLGSEFSIGNQRTFMDMALHSCSPALLFYRAFKSL